MEHTDTRFIPEEEELLKEAKETRPIAIDVVLAVPLDDARNTARPWRGSNTPRR